MTKAMMNGAGAVLLALAASAVTAQVGDATQNNMMDNEMSYNNSTMTSHATNTRDHARSKRRAGDNASDKATGHTNPNSGLGTEGGNTISPN